MGLNCFKAGLKTSLAELRKCLCGVDTSKGNDPNNQPLFTNFFNPRECPVIDLASHASKICGLKQNSPSLKSFCRGKILSCMSPPPLFGLIFHQKPEHIFYRSLYLRQFSLLDVYLGSFYVSAFYVLVFSLSSSPHLLHIILLIN